MRFELAEGRPVVEIPTSLDLFGFGAEEAPVLTKAHIALTIAKRELALAVASRASKEALGELAQRVERAKEAFLDAVKMYEGHELVVVFVWDQCDSKRARVVQFRVDEERRLHYREVGCWQEEERVRAEFICVIAKPLPATCVVN